MEGSQKVFQMLKICLWTHSRSAASSHEFYRCYFNSLKSSWHLPVVLIVFFKWPSALCLTGGSPLNWRESNGLIKGPKKDVKNLPLSRGRLYSQVSNALASCPSQPSTLTDGDGLNSPAALLNWRDRCGTITEGRLDAVAFSLLPTSWDWVTPWLSTQLAFRKYFLLETPLYSHTQLLQMGTQTSERWKLLAWSGGNREQKPEWPPYLKSSGNTESG